jgi:hypothetical protein
LIIDCEFYVVLNKTNKTLITCLLIFLFAIGNCHFNDIWHFVDWINFIGIAVFISYLWSFKVNILNTVNREILVMVLFWPILAPKYEVPKLNTPKNVTLQKLTAKIEHCLNIFLYLYSLVCTLLVLQFLSMYYIYIVNTFQFDMCVYIHV